MFNTMSTYITVRFNKNYRYMKYWQLNYGQQVVTF